MVFSNDSKIVTKILIIGIFLAKEVIKVSDEIILQQTYIEWLVDRSKHSRPWCK